MRGLHKKRPKLSKLEASASDVTPAPMASLARRSLPFILATRRAHTAPLPAGTGAIARPNHPSGHMQELSADDDRHGGFSPPEAHKPQRKLRVRGGFRTAGQQLFSAPAPRGEPYEIMKACDVAAALADDGARWTWPTRSPSWQPLTNLLMLHYHARVGPRTEFALAHTPVRRRLAASAASCAQFCFRRRRQRRPPPVATWNCRVRQFSLFPGRGGARKAPCA